MDFEFSAAWDAIKEGTKELAEVAHEKTSSFHETREKNRKKETLFPIFFPPLDILHSQNYIIEKHQKRLFHFSFESTSQAKEFSSHVPPRLSPSFR